MAGKGTYAAYQRLRPLEADFAGVAEKQEAAMRAEMDRQKAERDEREKKRQELAQQFAQDFSTLGDVVTNNKTIDEAFARGISSARDMMGDLYRQIQSNPSLNGDVNTQMKLQNLRKYASNLSTIGERYKTYAAMIGEGMQSGELSSWNSGALSDMDSIFVQHNLDVNVDENGMPIAVISEVDEDGNQVYDADMRPVLKELNLIEVLDGRGLETPVRRYDFMKGVMELGSKVGTREVTLPNGEFSHIEYQRFEDVEQSVRNLVSGSLGSVNRPTDIAKSIWSDAMGNDATELTAENMEEIEDFYTESIKTFYNEKNKTKIDVDAREKAKSKAQEDAEEMETGLELITNDEGEMLKMGKAQIGEEFSGMAVGFTPKEPVTFINSKGEKVMATRVFLGDDEKVYYEGAILKGAASEKVVDEETLNESTVKKQIFDPTLGGEYSGDGDLFARALPGNVKSLGDLRRRLLDKKAGFTLDQAKQQISDEEAAAKADELLKKYGGSN